jgi:hypothetical protein
VNAGGQALAASTRTSCDVRVSKALQRARAGIFERRFLVDLCGG